MKVGVTRDDADPVLVELYNRDHLAAVYGEDFAAAALLALQRRAHGWGGSVSVVDDRRFLVALAPDADRDPPDLAEASLVERWQRAFSAAPFAFGQQRALLAVGVGRATLGAGLRQMDGGHFQLQEIECRNSGAPLLLPPQCGWSWRLGYELDMEAALAFHEALAQGRAHLAFQPIVSSAQLAARLSHTAESGPTGVPLYQEALLRMVARDGEAPLSASRLVAALERLGLVRLFDQAVLSAVIRVLEAQPDLSLGCNLSSLSLVPDEGWWGSVLARLKARPSVASRLTFEITETAPLRDFDHAVALIRRLKALGCRIAIDDLGVGHTRLDFVRAIRPSIIKISADLVHDAAVNRTASEQLERLGAMAAAFAPVVVAEGIGTRRQMDAAWEAGIHWLQGEAAAAHILPSPQVSLRLPCEQISWS
ncbi:EAL domain-containing protein [Pseudoxanthomonas sp. UC19_8]|uniref:EAL domain-containing protein n=1 Tax=Pseudoxanthomonas sp. UC19_8 TaxID=3350175 RepID=UPI0036D254DE